LNIRTNESKHHDCHFILPTVSVSAHQALHVTGLLSTYFSRSFR